MSRKGAKSRTHGRKPRSTGTKAGQRVTYGRNSDTRLQDQLEALTRELAEAQRHADEARRQAAKALEQQTATSEVLRIIASSTGDLASVFQVILENAVRILEAKFGILFRREGDFMRPVAGFGLPPKFREFHAKRGPFRPLRDLASVLHTKKPIQKADAATEIPEAPAVKFGGARTHMVVPLLKADEVVGAYIIYRTEVRPFTDKQIEVVQNFASQAVIVIENTRLLNELRESLQQQTATVDVLQVISSSPGELEPVFQAMLENAVHICEANFGTLQLRENDAFRVAATHNPPPAYAEARRRNPLIYPTAHNAAGRVMATKRFVHIADYTQELAYKQGDPAAVSLVELAGARTLILVPMLKEGELVGNLLLYRQEVRPFTDKQIALLQNFAAQAVIAIENTRLLNELRESLQQQTATSEVLQVISSSPGELEPVFEAMLENAVRICEAKCGNLFLYEGGAFRTGALFGAPPGWAEMRQRDPIFGPGPKAPLSRVARTRQVFHIEDARLEQAYIERDPTFVGIVELGGARALLVVPMLKEGELIGAIVIYRQEVRPFTDKQIELVQNFASQGRHRH